MQTRGTTMNKYLSIAILITGLLVGNAYGEPFDRSERITVYAYNGI